MDGPVSRRALFRRGVTATALVSGAGALLAACARPAGAGSRSGGAQPVPQHGKTVIVMRPWGAGTVSGTTPAAEVDLLYEATQPWRAKNPGVDVQIVENTGGPAAIIASILAGKGPDIYHNWHPGTMFAQAGFAADLRPYLQKYNADLSTFNTAQLDLFQLSDGSIRGLPYYLGTQTMCLDLTMLDTLNLQLPEPGWTYQAYAKLATDIAATARYKVGGKSEPVYGGAYGIGSIGAPSAYLPPTCVLQGFGGSYVLPGDATKCNLGAQSSIAAVQWAFDLAQHNAILPPGASGTFGTTLAMRWAESWQLARGLQRSAGQDWEYFAMPVFLEGPVSTATADFWALNPHSPHVDLAWDLLYWCAFEPEWQVSNMKIFLLSPAQTTLWDQWVAYVPTLAPPLANKNIQAFADVARSGKAYPQAFFTRQDPQAENLIDAAGQQIWQGADITTTLTGVAQQVDALEIALASAGSSA